MAPGWVVHGGLWIVTHDCLRALDRFEGYPCLYDRSQRAIKLRGQDDYQLAIAYHMQDTGRELAGSSPGYFETIRQGYVDFGLEWHVALLERAAQQAEAAEFGDALAGAETR